MEEKNIEQDEITIDLWILLRDFIRGCIKFWWLILALMVAGGAIMFVTNIQTYTPMYQASATFTVTTNTTTDQNNQKALAYGWIVVSKDGVWSVLNTNFEEIIGAKFASIYFCAEIN